MDVREGWEGKVSSFGRRWTPNWTMKGGMMMAGVEMELCVKVVEWVGGEVRKWERGVWVEWERVAE